MSKVAILIALLLCFQKEVVAMNNTEFWKFIDEINLQNDIHERLNADYLVASFEEISSEELKDSYIHFESAIEELDHNNVYALGSVLNGQTLSDDGFRYFRAWLMTFGRDLMDLVLTNPSELVSDEAKISILLYANNQVEYEDFYYFIDDAFNNRYGSSVYDAIEDEVEIVDTKHDSMTMEDIHLRYPFFSELEGKSL